MLLEKLLTSPFEFVLIFAGLIIAIGLHEAAHCYMADRLGDPTPRSMGRLTLNPLAHLDPLGTLAIIFAGFGWGKPAPFDPYNLANPKRDTALIALAGPLTNFALAIVFALILRTTNLPYTLNDVILRILDLNLSLGVFNLLPIPPLDGSKIFLQNVKINPQTGYFILIFLLITGLIGTILGPIVGFLLNLLLS